MTLPPDNIIHLVAESMGLASETVRMRLMGLEMYNPEGAAMMAIVSKEATAQRERADELEIKVDKLSSELILKDAAIAEKDAIIAARDATIAEKENRIEEYRDKESQFWRSKIALEDSYEELRMIREENVPRVTKKKCISFNALLVRIGAVMSRLGSAASENIADCFEKGFDRQWMDEFWRALYDRPDWVQWLTDDSSLKYKNFLMVIGKLMSLRVFKRDTSKLSSCFDFPIMERSKKHYLTDGANFFAEKHPELNCWIEEYVATHLAS